MKVSFNFQFSRYDAFMFPKPFLKPRSPEDVELVVIDSKTQCPDCGRVVRVNVKRGFLYSHAPKGEAGNCPIRTPYYLGPDPRKVDTSGVSYAAWVSVADVSASKSLGARRLHQECRLRVL